MLNTTSPFAVGTYSACHAALQGIKLELFIFDTFPMASKVSLLEVRLSPRTHIPQPALSGFCIPTLHPNAIAAVHGICCTEWLNFDFYLFNANTEAHMSDWRIRTGAAAGTARRQSIRCLCRGTGSPRLPICTGEEQGGRGLAGYSRCGSAAAALEVGTRRWRDH